MWRSRYRGGLSESEEQFAGAMVAHAGRRRRRLQIAAAAAIVIALTVAVVTTAFWRQSLTAERQARAESQRAEAAKLLALAQVELDRFPTAALAYATKSVETHDTPEARRFALRALWRGPTALVLPWITANGGSVDFSPDGKWFAFVGNSNESFLLPENGRNPLRLDYPPTPLYPHARFEPSGRFLIVAGPSRNEIRIFSGGDGVLRRRMSFEGDTYFKIGSSRLFTLTTTAPSPPRNVSIRSWNFDGSGATPIGALSDQGKADLHPGGDWLASLLDGDSKLRRQWLKSGRIELLWDAGKALKTMPDSKSKVFDLSFSPDGDSIAIILGTGFLVKSLGDGSERQLLFPNDEKTRADIRPRIGSRGVLWSDNNSTDYFWDFTGPPNAEPRQLRHAIGDRYLDSTFHPDTKWAATLHPRGVAFWPLGQPQMRVFSGPDAEMAAVNLAFTADSQWLAVCAPIGGLTLLPLNAAAGARFMSLPNPICQTAALHPDGRRVVAAGYLSGVYVASVAGGAAKALLEQTTSLVGIRDVAVDRSGRFAVATLGPRLPDCWLGVWDLQTGTMRRFPRPPVTVAKYAVAAGFAYDGSLLLDGPDGIHRWNVHTGEHKLFFRTGQVPKFAVSTDGEHVLATQGKQGTEQLVLLDLRHGTSRRIATHGLDFSLVALDVSARVVMTADSTGMIRIGKATGEEPHLLIGHRGPLRALTISADGKTIASSGEDGTVRLWPMPDLSKPPLHTLPYEEFLTKLKSLTNLRVVPDKNSDTGYRVAYDSFPGWKDMPMW